MQDADQARPSMPVLPAIGLPTTLGGLRVADTGVLPLGAERQPAADLPPAETADAVVGHRLLAVTVFVALDALALWASYYSASLARVSLNGFFSHQFSLDEALRVLPPLVAVIPLYVAALAACGLYQQRRAVSIADLSVPVARAVSLALVLLIVSSFFFSRNLYSRSMVALLWPATVAWLLTLRGVQQLVALRLAGHSRPLERVAILGGGPEAERLAAQVRDGSSGILVVGRVGLNGRRHIGPSSLAMLGDAERIESVIERHQLDHLILTDDSLSAEALAMLAGTCGRKGVSVHKLPASPGDARERLWIANGVPLVDVRAAELSKAQRAAKRLLDLMLCIPLLLLTLPLLGLLALVVYLELPGPVLFRQRRRGRGGRYFTMLKLRSMRPGAEEQRDALAVQNEHRGLLFKMRSDPRVTDVGYVLRKYSLDELPQLFNVLRGEMSLVGPRPLPIQDIEARLTQPNLRYWVERREDVLPGITGLWQVRGRSELDFEEMLVLDNHYIRHWSLAGDIEILARTIPAVLGCRGAY